MNQHTVALTRVFDAPRSRVFECWTRAEHLQHWFGPPDGKDYWVRGQFRELDFPKHLVIACTADDDKGVERLQEVIEVTFTESEGRTTVSLNAVARGPSDEAAAMLRGMDQGWAQTVDRLGSHLRRQQ